MASSFSYGVVNRSARTFTIINAEPRDDRVDILIDVKLPSPGETGRMWEVRSYYEGIESELFEDGPPYWILWLILSSDKESVLTSRYVYYDHTSRQVLDYVDTEANSQEAMRLARFALYCDGIYNDLPKAIVDAVKISTFVKDNDHDEEICAICHDEYQQDRMNGTLRCKHSFHEECIKNWLKRKNFGCPICRRQVFRFKASVN